MQDGGCKMAYPRWRRYILIKNPFFDVELLLSKPRLIAYMLDTPHRQLGCSAMCVVAMLIVV
jgi:hypothetical protein